jgi:hypothetical protein
MIRSGRPDGNPEGQATWMSGVVNGVWLFFENSTGCLICQCQVVFSCGLFWLWGFFGRLFVGVCFLTRFLLESLILAQDERWRRA